MSRRSPLARTGIFLLFAILFSGALVLFTASREIPILMYHFVNVKEIAVEDPLIVSVETFEKQLQLLKSWGYRVYSLDEYEAVKSGKKSFGGKGVVLTFDDGNRDFAEHVLPILERHHAPAANFLIWNNLSRQEMGSMTFDQARELAQDPLVTFGAHSMSHRELVNLNERELEEEIVGSKKALEDILKISVRYFSYPGGYFDQATLAKVKDAGYLLAFTTSCKRLACRAPDPFSIPRLKVSEKDANPAFFWLKVSGIQSMSEKVKFWIACEISKMK